ncbi:CoA transferase [Microbacterium sp. ZW T5_45]|uniref:CoA transferase n=1 Tax=Microbacterium sp. ZW T5_45 TaxID=3378080 RepID=UPI00385359E1
MTPVDAPLGPSALARRVLHDVGLSDRAAHAVEPPHPVPLASRLAADALAWGSVDTVRLLAGIRSIPNPDRIAFAYRSDRLLRIDGAHPRAWSPYSGFWETRGGWIRTHGNYPHHAARLLRALGLSDDADADTVRRTLSALPGDEAVSRITAEGGLAVPVLPEDPRLDAALRRTPILHVRRLDPTGTLSVSDDETQLRGIRVLDLTRVIAGPVATRTLALLGAAVLRIDPPQLPEPDGQHLDTGHGKRSAILDARASGPELEKLIRQADVVVLGYRPTSLERLGLSPEILAERHPGLVIAELSAWGPDAPGRAGFDSLVQAESGIAMVESADGSMPGVLPAQALDHSAGYLLAAGVLALLERRRREGGTWIVRTSLRRIAAELLGMPRRATADSDQEIDVREHLATFDVGGRTVTTVRPVLPGLDFRAPRRFGGDQPRW